MCYLVPQNCLQINILLIDLGIIFYETGVGAENIFYHVLYFIYHILFISFLVRIPRQTLKHERKSRKMFLEG